MLNCLKHVVRPSSFIYFWHDYVALLFDLSVRLDEVIAGIDKIIDTTHVKKTHYFSIIFYLQNKHTKFPFLGQNFSDETKFYVLFGKLKTILWDKIPSLREHSLISFVRRNLFGTMKFVWLDEICFVG